MDSTTVKPNISLNDMMHDRIGIAQQLILCLGPTAEIDDLAVVYMRRHRSL